MNIEEFRTTLHNLSQQDKLFRIQQEIINNSFSRMPGPGGPTPTTQPDISTEDLELLKKEVAENHEAYLSKTSRKELIPFMTDFDKNWFYNKKNFGNHALLEQTVEFIEGLEDTPFETIDFLNLLQWHSTTMQEMAEKPFDFIDHIRELPIPLDEVHLLLAGLLKWYGGIPVSNDHDVLYIIRKQVEKEFLKQYPGERTVGFLYCQSDKSYNEHLATLSETFTQQLQSNSKLAVPGTPDMSPPPTNHRKPSTIHLGMSKVDYVRVINALYEIKAFQDANGLIPYKKDVMAAFGQLVNEDLSTYDKILSTALTTKSEEANMAIFGQLKEKAQQLFDTKLKKP